MSARSALKYISDLHKRQRDPAQWPDFLTGLPDRYAVLRAIDDAYSQLDKKSITYLRIANIHPYLLKYGTERHIPIIEWCAAILKVAADKYGLFIGAYDTHDFVAIGDRAKVEAFIAEASSEFEKKALTFYSKEDASREHFLSFRRESEQVNIGRMKLIHSTVVRASGLPRAQVVLYLSSMCTESESAMSLES